MEIEKFEGSIEMYRKGRSCEDAEWFKVAPFEILMAVFSLKDSQHSCLMECEKFVDYLNISCCIDSAAVLL